MIGRLRRAVRAGRLRRASWVRALDSVRALFTRDGRALLWTRFRHNRQLHQTSGYTEPDRYPDLFDLAAALRPDARRILSFGCSTGEEIESIRNRFPNAQIVAAEINPRFRKLARQRMSGDPSSTVVAPSEVSGSFDLVFALAVLQLQPSRVQDGGIEDLSQLYPFRKFEDQIEELVNRLSAGGLLCVMHTHYRVEDSRDASRLQPVAASPALHHPLFAPNGGRMADSAQARSLFIKLED